MVFSIKVVFFVLIQVLIKCCLLFLPLVKILDVLKGFTFLSASFQEELVLDRSSNKNPRSFTKSFHVPLYAIILPSKIYLQVTR